MLNNFQLYNKQKYIYYDYFLLIRFLDKFNIRVTHCNFAFTVFIKRKKKIFLKNLNYFPTSKPTSIKLLNSPPLWNSNDNVTYNNTT